MALLNGHPVDLLRRDFDQIGAVLRRTALGSHTDPQLTVVLTEPEESRFLSAGDMNLARTLRVVFLAALEKNGDPVVADSISMEHRGNTITARWPA